MSYRRLAFVLHLSSDIIEELISRGQQVNAVHFIFEVDLVDEFPPVPLLKAFLKDAKKLATSILEDPNNTGRAAVLLKYYFWMNFFFPNHFHLKCTLCLDVSSCLSFDT